MLQAGDSFKLERTFQQPLSLEGANLLSHLHSAPWTNCPILLVFLQFDKIVSFDVLFGDKNENTGVVGLPNLAISYNILYSRHH